MPGTLFQPILSSLRCKLLDTWSDGLSPKTISSSHKLLLVNPPTHSNSNLGQWHLLGARHRAGCARPPRQSGAHVAVHGAAGAFAAPAAPGAESSPRVQSFPRPDPHPGRDAH